MKIGELARATGINPRTLRYYERIGLLPPAGRTAAGYRLYTARDAARLAFIRRAQGLGLSLAAIAAILAAPDAVRLSIPPHAVRVTANARRELRAYLGDALIRRRNLAPRFSRRTLV